MNLFPSNKCLGGGISIGTNVEERIGAQSKADFISKFSRAYKEAKKISYWLRLLCYTNYILKRMIV